MLLRGSDHRHMNKRENGVKKRRGSEGKEMQKIFIIIIIIKKENKIEDVTVKEESVGITSVV